MKQVMLYAATLLMVTTSISQVLASESKTNSQGTITFVGEYIEDSGLSELESENPGDDGNGTGNSSNDSENNGIGGANTSDNSDQSGKTHHLPQTGERNRTSLMGLGAMAVAGATLLFVTKKRKETVENEEN